MNLRYEEPQRVDRALAEETFARGSAWAISETLVSLALHDPEWEKTEADCISFLRHADEGVRMTAVLCLGHTARIHRRLHVDLVLPLLEELHRWEPNLRGRIEDAMSDIHAFLGPSGPEV